MSLLEPLLAAAIGVGGVIAGQLLSAWTTTRRDRQRDRVADQRRSTDQAAARAERFADAKLAVYAQMAELTYEAISAATQIKSVESTDVRSPRLVRDLEAIDPLRWQVRLIGAPTVTARSELCYTLTVLTMVQVGLIEEFTVERRKETASKALSAWQSMLGAMRADIAGDTVALERMSTTDLSELSGGGPAGDRINPAQLEERIEQLRRKAAKAGAHSGE